MDHTNPHWFKMKFIGSLCLMLALWPCMSLSFVPQLERVSVRVESRSSTLSASRRDFMESVVQTTVLGTAAFLSVPAQEAMASGGATAGGAYLLSAKQRYNERVKAGVKGFLALQPALEAGNIDPIREYFTSEDTGSWKDLTAAGYLLANAFRRNSTASPDSLPAVKVSRFCIAIFVVPQPSWIPLFPHSIYTPQAWKKYAASVEAITKALKKKDIKGAQATYVDTLAALDEYLKEVELPDAKELALS